MSEYSSVACLVERPTQETQAEQHSAQPPTQNEPTQPQEEPLLLLRREKTTDKLRGWDTFARGYKGHQNKTHDIQKGGTAMNMGWDIGRQRTQQKRLKGVNLILASSFPASSPKIRRNIYRVLPTSKKRTTLSLQRL